MTAVFHQWQILEVHLDAINGSDQVGRRAVVVISNDGFNENVPYLTVLPISTTPRAPAPSEVSLPAGLFAGGDKSTVMAHHIRTISEQSVSTPIGEIRDERLRREIIDAVLSHLGREVSTLASR
ncbi:MAG TPA: type II toxin-antitoxin system PemK/MazF family toxin [Candidatus Dormibacteraeota bacterium]